MTIISFSFKNIKEIFKTEDVLDILIKEKEGESPRLEATFPISMFSQIDLCTHCSMLINDIVVFNGKILEVTTNLSCCSIFIDGASGQKAQEIKNTIPGFMNLFSDENSELSSSLEICQYNKVGEMLNTSVIVPDNVLEITDEIVKDSLEIKKTNKNVISDIDLEISASWISRVEGDIDLSSKIAKRFKLGKINTLTPNKLVDSWPAFGDKISNSSNSRQTKYYIGHSRLIHDQLSRAANKEIEIFEDMPKLSLKHEFFDNKLTLSWGFDQFRTETISSKIINCNGKNGISRKIRVNLKNVQEYVEDIYDDSFFTTDIGGQIIEYIYKMIGDHIIFSMRNIELSFEINLDCNADFISSLGPHKWLKIKDHVAKITEIDYKISKDQKIIKIKAAAFEKGFKSINQILKPPKLEKFVKKDLAPDDIIHDIVIQNEAEDQFKRLANYISELKMLGQIKKNNYRKLILNFLNENQTKINIIAKPIKIQHCEKKVVITEVVLYNGTD